MTTLRLNQSPNLTRESSALEHEPISNPQIFSAPGSEILDRFAADWQLRLHDGAVIDHILEVINRPRKGHGSRASLSNSPPQPRARIRPKTTLTLPQSLHSSGRREFSLDHVRGLA